MLVEDDHTMIDLLSTLFSLEGFEVTGLNDFDDTLKAIRAASPDVVLLDVHLSPSLSGFDVLKALRSDGDLREIKVVMSSGLDFTAQCQQNGADGFILKPYMPNDLIALIRGLL